MRCLMLHAQRQGIGSQCHFIFTRRMAIGRCCCCRISRYMCKNRNAAKKFPVSSAEISVWRQPPVGGDRWRLGAIHRIDSTRSNRFFGDCTREHLEFLQEPRTLQANAPYPSAGGETLLWGSLLCFLGFYRNFDRSADPFPVVRKIAPANVDFSALAKWAE